MQSSLMRFFALREKEKLTKRVSPVPDLGETEGPSKKRAKVDKAVRLDRLKQFARNDSREQQDTFTSDLHSTSVEEAHRDGASCISRLTTSNVSSMNGSTDTGERNGRSLAKFRVPSSQADVSKTESVEPHLVSSSSGRGSVSQCGSSSGGYTPMEQQYLSIKANYPDAVLFIECGYKYRFFGEDAQIASRVLNIGCNLDHNFYTGSIPVHRLNIHIRRMVAAGYKVGVVKQMETAALKAASDKRSGPFTRELTALYTRTTLIGPDVESPLSSESHVGGSEGLLHVAEPEDRELYLMCLCEQQVKSVSGNKRKKGKERFIGFLAVQPSAGNMIYDEFQDNTESFSELETRLFHLQPAEVLYPKGASKPLITMLSQWRKYSGIGGLRYEELPGEWFDYNKAFPTVTDFYGSSSSRPSPGPTTSEDTDEDASSPSSMDTTKMAEALQVAINLPSTSLCCLGALIHHLKPFRLQKVLTITSNLQPFSTGSHCMRLNSRTLENLEIFKNQTTKTDRGTLFGVLNHACTPFGRRMLIKWITYPLRNLRQLKQRQEAVSELTTNGSPSVSLLRECILRLPDLERMLCSAYHKKCSPSQFYTLVKNLSHIHDDLEAFSEMASTDISSELLSHTIKEVPLLLGCIRDFLSSLKEQAARDGDYENIFTDLNRFPEILKEKLAIAEVKQKLVDYRKQIRKILCNYSLDYVTVSGTQYLVEVKNKNMARVPSDWIRVSSTKQVSRFHPPYVLEAIKLLAQHTDQLKINAQLAWDEFLTDFSVHYGSCKKAVEHLATVDCLFSLAKVAKMPGYVCPEVVEEQVIEIRDGRHPVIDVLLGEGEQYVPNDTTMSLCGVRTMIITGPNMGGKSCYIKQVALICIMAQIGSFVPATSARVGVLDAVYTRMGALDNIHTGKSTFMVELMEASEILRLATSNSLVILDELGRGTSTHDGTAIAYSTLVHFIEKVKSFVLFVTHYPLLAELEPKYPETVANFHMAYVEVEESSEDYEKVVFLYQLERGEAGGSYGLNVAALAGLPHSILRLAQTKSRQLQQTVNSKAPGSTTDIKSLLNLFSKTCNNSY